MANKKRPTFEQYLRQFIEDDLRGSGMKFSNLADWEVRRYAKDARRFYEMEFGTRTAQKSEERR